MTKNRLEMGEECNTYLTHFCRQLQSFFFSKDTFEFGKARIVHVDKKGVVVIMGGLGRPGVRS